MFRQRINIIKKDIEDYKRYLDGVKNIIIADDPRRYDRYLTAINEIEKITGLLNDADPKTLSDFSRDYQYASQLDNALDIIDELLQNQKYNKMMLFNMSSTFAGDFFLRKNVLISNIEKYRTMSDTNDETIINNETRKLMATAANRQRALEFIIDTKDINKFTIAVLLHLMRHLPTNETTSLHAIIEKQIDAIFNSTSRTYSDLTSRMPIFSHKFPPGDYYSLNELLAKIQPDSVTGLISDGNSGNSTNSDGSGDDSDILEEFVAENNCRIIVVNTNAKTPAVYNLSALNDVMINSTSGINKDFIKMFNSIFRIMPRDITTPESLKYYGKTGKTYLIESINGKLYRLLDTFVTVTSPLIKISSRAHDYNKLQSGFILSRCFDKTIEPLLVEYAAAKIVKRDIVSIRISIETTLEDQLIAHNEIEPFTAETYHKFISSKETYQDVLYNKISQRRSTVGRKSFNSPEYILTELADCVHFVNEMIKEVNTAAAKQPIGDITFKEFSGKQLIEKLAQNYKSICNTAITELVRKGHFGQETEANLKEYIMDKKNIVL